MSRLTFREWSLHVGLGQQGFDILAARRHMRQAVIMAQRGVLRDAMLHGRGIARISMGEGCTPIIRRVDPFDFYVHPQDRGDT